MTNTTKTTTTTAPRTISTSAKPGARVLKVQTGLKAGYDPDTDMSGSWRDLSRSH